MVQRAPQTRGLWRPTECEGDRAQVSPGEPEGEPEGENPEPDGEDDERAKENFTLKSLWNGFPKKPPPAAGALMVKALRLPSSTTRPWENVDFAAPPPAGGRDKWVVDRLLDGWLIRVHREPTPRRRCFHPLHSHAPVPGRDLHEERTTVMFLPNQRERFVVQDEWDGPVRNLHENQWTGWTFFRVRDRDGALPDGLHPGGLGVPDGDLRGLLPEMGEVSATAVAKAYAPQPTSRVPKAKAKTGGPGLVLAGDGRGGTVLGYAASPSAQHQPLVTVSRGRGSAVDRAQPVLADLRRRDEGHGHLPPAEEELSGSWSEVSEEA